MTHSDEFELIDRIAAMVNAKTAAVGIGDDAAVLDEPGPDYLLATVDMLVEGVHFVRDRVAPQDLGERALAVNLSDIAAMGGRPFAALVSLAVPPDLPEKYLDELYRGINRLAQPAGVAVVGGNLSAAEMLAIDVTVLGRVPKDQLVLRSGAEVGDALVVTGVLGEAAAARMLADLESASEPVPIPQARLQVGQRLAASGLVHAMMDLSDGLGGDLHHLANASEVGAVIYAADVPIGLAARAASDRLGKRALDVALFGGEDYELLIAVAPDDIEAARQGCGSNLYQVGTILSLEHGVLLEEVGGKRVPLRQLGWRHF